MCENTMEHMMLLYSSFIMFFIYYHFILFIFMSILNVAVSHCFFLYLLRKHKYENVYIDMCVL